MGLEAVKVEMMLSKSGKGNDNNVGDNYFGDGNGGNDIIKSGKR
jgi:hypothetical protein